MADKLEVYSGVFGDGTKSMAEMACEELQYWYQGKIAPPNQGIGLAFDLPNPTLNTLFVELQKSEPIQVAEDTVLIVKTDKIDFLQGVYPSEKTYTVSLWQKLWRKIA